MIIIIKINFWIPFCPLQQSEIVFAPLRRISPSARKFVFDVFFITVSLPYPRWFPFHGGESPPRRPLAFIPTALPLYFHQEILFRLPPFNLVSRFHRFSSPR